MKPAIGRAALHLSFRTFTSLLVLYPRPFREEYGASMSQVFKTGCEMAYRNRAIRHLMGFWLYAFLDLLVSAVRERRADLQGDALWRLTFAYGMSAILASGTGYIHLRTDSDAVTGALVVTGACICGFTCPRRTWRWALIIGCGVPVLLLVGHTHGILPLHRHDADTPSPMSFLPAFLGGYAGALLSRIIHPNEPAALRQPTRTTARDRYH